MAAFRLARQSTCVERCNRTIRQEWCDQYSINNIEERQHFTAGWLWTYNNDHPNMGIASITPAKRLKTAA